MFSGEEESDYAGKASWTRSRVITAPSEKDAQKSDMQKTSGEWEGGGSGIEVRRTPGQGGKTSTTTKKELLTGRRPNDIIEKAVHGDYHCRVERRRGWGAKQHKEKRVRGSREHASTNIRRVSSNSGAKKKLRNEGLEKLITRRVKIHTDVGLRKKTLIPREKRELEKGI